MLIDERERGEENSYSPWPSEFPYVFVLFEFYVHAKKNL